ncbi:hypothetical protein F5Y04DRAFT_266448 [Hypomontagnella monticulosa]|nr:hypothetical protein F5Y04DRAFT_266448 [Hypomontagnella monticulosa]
MKIIITGATGFVGGEVVRQAIADPRISHAFVLTRKPLPDEFSKNEKVTVIEHKDFSSYPPELLEQLTGAEGCIWAIGGRAYQFPDLETAKKVSIDYTIAGAKAFLEVLAPKLPEPQKFRFVFCSGKYAEWDQNKSLLLLKDTRLIKGQVEKSLCELADANKDKLEVWAVRPSAITKKHAPLINSIGLISVDRLAKAMLKIVTEGYHNRIIELDELVKM